MEYAKYVTGTAELGIVRICDRYHRIGVSGRNFIEQLERDEFYFRSFSEIIGEDLYGHCERIVWFHDIGVVYIVDRDRYRIDILGIF